MTLEQKLDREFKENLRYCLERHLSKADAKIIAEDIFPVLKRQAWKFGNRAVELQHDYAVSRKVHAEKIAAE